MSDKDRSGSEPAPDEGPTMSQAGAEPAGDEMSNWNQANPNPDATAPETMPSEVEENR
jgi:hypothetical protein